MTFNTRLTLGNKENQECGIPVNVDLGKSIVNSLLLITSRQCSLQEGKENLEPIAGFDLGDKLIDGNRCRIDDREKTLDDRLITVDIQQTTDDSRGSCGIHSLDIDLNRLELLVLVKVEDQVVNEVEAVADDDERELFGQLGLF